MGFFVFDKKVFLMFGSENLPKVKHTQLYAAQPSSTEFDLFSTMKRHRTDCYSDIWEVKFMLQLIRGSIPKLNSNYLRERLEEEMYFYLLASGKHLKPNAWLEMEY